MPTFTSLRDRKKAATRQALQDAALDLFLEKGFGSTSVDEIAAAAEVSRSTFFRYFGSKEAVLFAEGDERGEEFVQMLRDRPQTEGPFTAFEEALVILAERAGEGAARENARRYDELMRSDETLQLRRFSEVERWTDAVAEAFAVRAGRTQPAPEDALAASTCIAVTHEVAERWRESQSDAIEVIRDAFQTLRRLTRKG